MKSGIDILNGKLENYMEENNNLQEKEEQYTVIREKIKARPVNKGKLFNNGLITVLSAVAFGLIACLTFVILSPGARIGIPGG